MPPNDTTDGSANYTPTDRGPRTICDRGRLAYKSDSSAVASTYPAYPAAHAHIRLGRVPSGGRSGRSLPLGDIGLTGTTNAR